MTFKAPFQPNPFCDSVISSPMVLLQEHWVWALSLFTLEDLSAWPGLSPEHEDLPPLP